MTRTETILLHRWLAAVPVALAAAAVAYLLFANADRKSTSPEDLVRALEQAREGQWDFAMAGTRAYLLDYPDDPFGHFLLGQCYLYGTRLQVTMASGELETALKLHERTGSLGAMQGRMEPDDFVYRVYKIRAVAELRIVRESMAYSLPRPFVVRHLHACLNEIRAGLERFPGDDFLLGMKAEVEQVLEEMNIAPPANPAEEPRAV